MTTYEAYTAALSAAIDASPNIPIYPAKLQTLAPYLSAEDAAVLYAAMQEPLGKSFAAPPLRVNGAYHVFFGEANDPARGLSLCHIGGFRLPQVATALCGPYIYESRIHPLATPFIATEFACSRWGDQLDFDESVVALRYRLQSRDRWITTAVLGFSNGIPDISDRETPLVQLLDDHSTIALGKAAAAEIVTDIRHSFDLAYCLHCGRALLVCNCSNGALHEYLRLRCAARYLDLCSTSLPHKLWEFIPPRYRPALLQARREEFYRWSQIQAPAVPQDLFVERERVITLENNHAS